MSKSKTIADYYLVTAFTARVHVRHLAVNGWVERGDGRNYPDSHPLCGTGDQNSHYEFAEDEHANLPVCKRCRHRLSEYIENLAAEQA